MLEATDGNLSVHARKLEEAGYVDCRKSFEGRVPRTEYRITSKGRRELERYLDHMETPHTGSARTVIPARVSPQPSQGVAQCRSQ